MSRDRQGAGAGSWICLVRTGALRQEGFAPPGSAHGLLSLCGSHAGPTDAGGQAVLRRQAHPHPGPGRGGVARRLSSAASTGANRGGVRAAVAEQGRSFAHESKRGVARRPTEARRRTADRRLQRRVVGEGRIRAEDSALQGASKETGSGGERVGAGGRAARRVALGDR